jgi:molecular chaperone DnaK
MSSDNKSLGRFILDGIPPAPRGVPKVEVTFAIDSNGILNVTAKDKGSGKEQSITIKDSGNLNKEDIEKAQKEAEAHAEEDAKKREAVEARNQLANAIYTGEKMKKEHKEKLSEEDVQVIDDAIKEAKDAEDSDDKNVLEKAANVMLEKLQPLGAKMYEEANKQPEDGKDSEKKADDKSVDEPVKARS